jgi:prolyl 4-hydroxylase
MSSNSAAQVQQLVSAGRYAEAVDRLTVAAESGDGDALYKLGTWRVSGQIIRRDIVAARELMGKAAEAGHAEAALILAHFLANGTGGRADWKKARIIIEQLADRHPAAAEQLAMLDQMSVGEEGNPTAEMEFENLSNRPAVNRFRGFFTAEECAYIVRKAEPRLQPSMVTHRDTGKLVAHPVRRSDGTFFGVATEDLVINALNRRIAAASGTNANQGEPLQVLRYPPGGEFRPHHDWVAGSDNQRIFTAIAYLSDDYEGGETRFLRTGLDFRGRTGDLLLFSNVTLDGEPDQLAEHAGLPVRAGVKLVASRWIWRTSPTFPAPAPILPSV